VPQAHLPTPLLKRKAARKGRE